MKYATIAFVITVAVAAVSARPQSLEFQSPVIPVLQRDEYRDERGQYTLQYVSGDGSHVIESGRLVPNNAGDDYTLIKSGSYTFTSPEGLTFTVEYESDQNGYRAKGAHLPQPVGPVA